ncbi:enhanced intracellular survival protein Eis [Lysinibacillus sp. SGAir0095]|uniref:GNAT family N-acetyltransferase n=1 Tax=Lysinibacillus sp. SGAir0095 TaxID=2070463 RepID=UPI0010CD54BA|nr:GNAT family N-acetyltransferase [Lysinibacillus sp. SGAir0095]QCR32568.1 GNAT family N-acetyltransferase [Lysinibacillus sp. SGAir0095]
MGEIRKLVSENEFTKFVDIVANAYPGILANAPQEKQKFKEFLINKQQEDAGVEFYGLFREQQLIAGMRIHYYEMNLYSKRIDIGGVGLVAVDLLHKKERAAKELIEQFLQTFKAKGVHLVALYPFRPDFYKNMGFGYGSSIHQYLLEPASFPKGKTKEHLIYVNEEDSEQLAACYNRFAESKHGLIYKTVHEWKALFKNSENRIIAFKKEDKIYGYMVFTFRKQSETNFMLNNLVIKECIYETPVSLMALCTFLNSQVDQVSRIEWNTQDEHVRFLVNDARNGSTELIPSVYHPSATTGIGLMYRIINVKGFITYLRHIQYFTPDLKWKLTVTDSFFPENQGEYLLQVKQGFLEIMEEKDYEVEVKIDISELSSLLMGVVSLKELYIYSKVEISHPTFLNVLNTLFNTLDKPMCLTAF